MKTILRLIIGIPIAAIVTFGLFTLMQILIFTDANPLEDEREDLRFDINPEVEELNARTRDTSIDDVSRVDPPPPPPQIERAAADLPTESLSTIVGSIPDFDAPQLNSGNVSFNVSDRNAQPLVRIPPQYPARAAERGLEGSCNMRFDVTPDGTPTNVEAVSCTSATFSRASIRAVERWRYSPKVENGVPVARRGVETTIEYEFND